jgi:hypothetical protein
MRDLIDPEDGENRAVRAFLMHYGAPGLTVKQQRDNMRRAGWDGFWPAWTADVDGHLTKLGAQNWLRYLFDLERASGVAEAPLPDLQQVYERVYNTRQTMPPIMARFVREVLAAGVLGTFNDQQEKSCQLCGGSPLPPGWGCTESQEPECLLYKPTESAERSPRNYFAEVGDPPESTAGVRACDRCSDTGWWTPPGGNPEPCCEKPATPGVGASDGQTIDWGEVDDELHTIMQAGPVVTPEEAEKIMALQALLRKVSGQ